MTNHSKMLELLMRHWSVLWITGIINTTIIYNSIRLVHNLKLSNSYQVWGWNKMLLIQNCPENLLKLAIILIKVVLIIIKNDLLKIFNNFLSSILIYCKIFYVVDVLCYCCKDELLLTKATINKLHNGLYLIMSLKLV